MRDRLLLCLMAGALPFASIVVSADDDAVGPTDSATVRISFTVPERIEAAARVTADDLDESSVCLTARGTASFAVNAVVREGADWQLAPVRMKHDSAVHDCDDDVSLSLDLNDSWYGANGMMTLLVSPL